MLGGDRHVMNCWSLRPPRHLPPAQALDQDKSWRLRDRFDNVPARSASPPKVSKPLRRPKRRSGPLPDAYYGEKTITQTHRLRAPAPTAEWRCLAPSRFCRSPYRSIFAPAACCRNSRPRLASENGAFSESDAVGMIVEVLLDEEKSLDNEILERARKEIEARQRDEHDAFRAAALDLVRL